MKKCIGLSLVMLFAFTTLAFSAETLTFGWSYPEAERLNITGFNLYQDGTLLLVEGIPATDSAVIIPKPTDKKSHVYHLTAVSLEDESGSSDTVIVAYKAQRPGKAVGFYLLEGN